MQHRLQAEIAALPAQKHRKLERIVFHTVSIGDIGIVVSLPDPLPHKKLPVLIVLGGLGTGENNIRYIKDAGDNAIIGYDWPMPVRVSGGMDLLLAMPDLYHRVMTIPAQMASAIDWLAAQPWADAKRIGLLGFSMGALAAPAIEDMAQHDGHPIDCTIIAYGGAPLGALFAANPHIKPQWLREVMAPVIDFFLLPVQPVPHLANISGRFLVLEGDNDALIPAAARAELRDAIPQPKDVVVFKGNHMGVGPDKLALLQIIIQTSRDWLIKNGAVDLPK